MIEQRGQAEHGQQPGHEQDGEQRPHPAGPASSTITLSVQDMPVATTRWWTRIW
jgi:hypothetical protein